jgi:spore maturation protein CgeB
MDQYYVWSERLVEKVRAEGITHVQYLGFGADPHFSFPVPLSDQDRARFGASVSFVGNWDDKRERWLQPIVASGIDVAIWGTNYWGTRARDPRIRNAWRGSTAMGTDMVKAATAAALSINILREQNEGGENMRTYELPACGALMLAEYSSPQAAAFPEGESAYYARTAEEMAAKAREISEMAAADREAVRRRAVEAARTQTYGHRARRVLDTTLGRG